MQPDKFTTLTQQAFQAAQNDATERGHSELTNEHLFRAFLDQTDGVTRPLLEKSRRVHPEARRTPGRGTHAPPEDRQRQRAVEPFQRLAPDDGTRRSAR